MVHMTWVRRSIEVAKAAAEICREKKLTDLKPCKGIHTKIKSFVLPYICSNGQIVVFSAFEVTIVVNRVRFFCPVIEKRHIRTCTKYYFSVLPNRSFEYKIQWHIHVVDELRVAIGLNHSVGIKRRFIFPSLIIKEHARLKIEFRFRSEP